MKKLQYYKYGLFALICAAAANITLADDAKAQSVELITLNSVVVQTYPEVDYYRMQLYVSTSSGFDDHIVHFVSKNSVFAPRKCESISRVIKDYFADVNVGELLPGSYGYKYKPDLNSLRNSNTGQVQSKSFQTTCSL